MPMVRAPERLPVSLGGKIMFVAELGTQNKLLSIFMLSDQIILTLEWLLKQKYFSFIIVFGWYVFKITYFSNLGQYYLLETHSLQ